MKTEFEFETALHGSRLVGQGCEPLALWVDIETVKVEMPWRRWQPFLIGVAGMIDPGVFFLDVVSGTEAELIDWFAASFENHQARYSATREFDEMVLRGRFTNARRAHRAEPGPWPNLDGKKITWKNLRKIARPVTWQRSPDVASKEVPAAWSRGQKELVVRHCLKDVVELTLSDPATELTQPLQRQLLELLS